MKRIMAAALGLAAGVLVCITQTSGQDAADFEPTKNYQVRQVHGWTAMIHPVLAKDHPELLDKTLTLLGHQLYQVERVAPKDAVAKMRQVKVWSLTVGVMPEVSLT